MKIFPRLALSLLMVGASGIVAHAQNMQPQNMQPQNAQPIYSPLTMRMMEAERTQNADSLLLAYGQAVTDPQLAREAIAQLLSGYYTMRNRARTAEQATQAVAEANLRFQVLQAAQNQVMVQQNQQILLQNAQIIALLQAQVNARR